MSYASALKGTRPQGSQGIVYPECKRAAASMSGRDAPGQKTILKETFMSSAQVLRFDKSGIAHCLKITPCMNQSPCTRLCYHEWQ